jgi:putative transposase
METVRRYIPGQEAQHRKLTFQEEFVALLNTHEIEYDERYIWK